LSEVAEPDPDRCHVDGVTVDVVALVIPGGDCPVLAEPVEGPLDGVALLAGLGVESGRAAALAAATEAVADLVGGFGDGGLDAASSRVSADRPAGVGLVSQHRARPGAG
jgi:hypothetical protein